MRYQSSSTPGFTLDSSHVVGCYWLRFCNRAIVASETHFAQTYNYHHHHLAFSQSYIAITTSLCTELNHLHSPRLALMYITINNSLCIELHHHYHLALYRAKSSSQPSLSADVHYNQQLTSHRTTSPLPPRFVQDYMTIITSLCTDLLHHKHLVLHRAVSLSAAFLSQSCIKDFAHQSKTSLTVNQRGTLLMSVGVTC